MAREYAPAGQKAPCQESEMTDVRRERQLAPEGAGPQACAPKRRSRANYSQPVGELYGAMKPIASISWIWPPQIL